jgi:hypothetical protein
MNAHNLLAVLALAFLVADAYANPPAPTHLTCVGLALLAASFI